MEDIEAAVSRLGRVGLTIHEELTTQVRWLLGGAFGGAFGGLYDSLVGMGRGGSWAGAVYQASTQAEGNDNNATKITTLCLNCLFHTGPHAG